MSNLFKSALAACLIALVLGAPDSLAAQEQAQPEAEATGAKIKLISRAEGESNGFRAVALITSDEDWLEKFQNPGENGPEFALAPRLAIGKPARLLVFYAGAFPAEGRVNVLCDLRLSQGGDVVHQTDPEPCSDTEDPGDETSLLLADSALVITPSEEDKGKFLKLEIGVTDGVRGEFVPLILHVRYGVPE